MGDDLDESGCYKNRNCLHRYMAPWQSCERCSGRGYYPSVDADGYEDGSLYCACAAGEMRRKVEDSNGQ